MEREGSLPSILKEKFSGNEILKINDYIFEIIKNTKELDKDIKKKDFVLLISGASGSGKDSIIELLPENFARAKTCTSRPVRDSEIENDPYVRFTPEEFEKGIKNNEFLETNLYDGNYYGSKVSEIKKVISLNKIPILRLDASGAKNVLEIVKKSSFDLENIQILYFFITPPYKKILKERVFRRDVENIKDAKKREEAKLKAIQRIKGTIEKDLDLMKYAHFVVINYEGKLEEVTKKLVDTFNSYLG